MQNKLIQAFLVWYSHCSFELFHSDLLTFSFSCFTSGLWCNTVENQLCYIYIIGKLMVLSPPSPPHNLYCPFSSTLRHYRLYSFKVSSDSISFLCLSEIVYKPLVYAVLIIWIYLIAILYPNHIQFFQYKIWCF